MARMASSDSQPSSYSSGPSYTSGTRTVSLTLAEVLQRVLNFEMSADELYRQAPVSLQQMLDEAGLTQFDIEFVWLTEQDQRFILKRIQEAVRDQEARAKRNEAELGERRKAAELVKLRKAAELTKQTRRRRIAVAAAVAVSIAGLIAAAIVFH